MTAPAAVSPHVLDAWRRVGSGRAAVARAQVLALEGHLDLLRSVVAPVEELPGARVNLPEVSQQIHALEQFLADELSVLAPIFWWQRRVIASILAQYGRLLSVQAAEEVLHHLTQVRARQLVVDLIATWPVARPRASTMGGLVMAVEEHLRALQWLASHAA